MKRIICLILTLVVVAGCFTACSSKNNGTSTKDFEGTYVPVKATIDGVVFTMDELPRDDVRAYSVILSADGTGEINFDDNTNDMPTSATWKLEDNKIVATNELGTVTGDIVDKDTIEYKNILGRDKNIVFARVGTEAATDMSRYLSDTDKALLGSWQSYEVRDVNGNDISNQIDPNSFNIVLNSDHSAKISVAGVCTDATNAWHTYTGIGLLDGDYINGTNHIIKFKLDGDNLFVRYSTEEQQYIYLCHKK